MVGAALSWLAQCDDVERIDITLRPLADAVSSGQLGATDAAALHALQPVLEALPPGSANAALLAVHRLLSQGQAAASGSGGSMHAAVAALAQLPEAMRDSCLQLVCDAVPAMPPGVLSEADVRHLLAWLLVRGGGSSARVMCMQGIGPLPGTSWLTALRVPISCTAGRRGAAACGQAASGGGGQHPGGAPCAGAQPGGQPHAAPGGGVAAAQRGCVMGLPMLLDALLVVIEVPSCNC